ncbi:hypothetical protein GGS20DRAFT_544929 [Poronia punctata]|nr:hypothetical protein GGS20DRAFT_544929 [Poronia punctata]
MSSLEEWRACYYGRRMDICDEGSLDLVQSIMEKYYAASSTGAGAQALVKGLQTRFQEAGEDIYRFLASSVASKLLRRVQYSADPLAHHSWKQLGSHLYAFWQKGTLRPGTIANTSSRFSVPNPLFSEALSENVSLHAATNPFLGHHLWEMMLENEIIMPRLSEWIDAYRLGSEGHIKLRFVVSDALALCHTLQGKPAGPEGLSANLFRRQLDPVPLILDPRQYESGDAPRVFDVIDASNVSDRVGILNLLAATSSLMRKSIRSTLHVDIVIHDAGSIAAALRDALCGCPLNLSLLTGLAPADFWAWCSSVPSFWALRNVGKVEGDAATEGRFPLSFKPYDEFFNVRKSSYAKPSVPATAFAETMADMYFEMTGYKDPGLKQRHSTCHAGSFAIFMKGVGHRINTDWFAFWKTFVQLVVERSHATGGRYLEELVCQLHLHEVHTDPWQLTPWLPKGQVRFAGINAWLNTTMPPPIICLTVVVPRRVVDELYTLIESESLQARLEGVVDIHNTPGTPHENRFSSVQIALGRIARLGSSGRGDDAPPVRIIASPSGWLGRSDMIVSFYVPNYLVLREPHLVHVGVGVQRYRHNGPHYSHVVPVTDESRVSLTTYMPGTDNFPMTCVSAQEKRGPSRQGVCTECIEPKFSFKNGRIISVTQVVSLPWQGDDVALAPKLKPLTPLVHRMEYRARGVTSGLEYCLPIPALSVSVTKTSKPAGYTPMDVDGTYFIVTAVANHDDVWTGHITMPVPYRMLTSPGGGRYIVGCHYVALDRLPIIRFEEWAERGWDWQVDFLHLDPMQGTNIHAPCWKVLFMLRHTIGSLMRKAAGEVNKERRSIFSMGAIMGGSSGHIIVNSIRVDGAAGTFVVDAVWLRMDTETFRREGLEQLENALKSAAVALGSKAAANAKMRTALARSCSNFLRCMAERCSTWHHQPGCGWTETDQVINCELDPSKLCSCGNGHVDPNQLPKEFTGLCGWEKTVKYMTRIAVSQTFVTPPSASPSLLRRLQLTGKDGGLDSSLFELD